jgi:RsmE family RNA methyltransferase
VIVADASGEAFGREMARGGGAGEHAGEGEGDMPERITLLVGPEGGFSAGELALARERGAAIARFGGHVMRIEVAAVVAAAMVLGA